MRHFRWISIAMVAGGLLLAVLTVVLPLDRFWVLGGAMLILSGAVKLVVLHLWRELGPPNPAATSTPSGPSIAPRKR